MLMDIGLSAGGDQIAKNNEKFNLVDDKGSPLLQSDGQEISAGGGISTALGLQYAVPGVGLRLEYKYGRVKDHIDFTGGFAETSAYRSHFSILKKLQRKHYLGLGLSRYASPNITECQGGHCENEEIQAVKNGITLNYLSQIDNIRLGITHYPVDYLTPRGRIDADSTDFYIGWMF